ncbi:MAG: efflux transporter outer membrane subunit [Rubrivivax sp.]|nr:efflux transporter outer membrane subunit [Rubrivivax sp.]
MAPAWWLLPAAWAVLAGCTTLGPDYQRPAVSLPPAYGEAAAAPDAATAPLAADWWTLFGDRTLDALVAKALAANADIAQAVARLEQADALVREASGATAPTLNAGAAGSRARTSARSRNNPGGTSIEDNNFAVSLSTSFELDFWGRLARANEAARAQLLASQAARDTVRLTVAGAVAQAWFALRSLDEQVATQRQTLRSREEGARVIGQRLAGGAASRLDAEQAEVQRADAALLLRELQRQRQIVQSQIALLVGEPGSVLPEPTPGAQALPRLPPIPPAGLPSALLERRPDIRRAEELLVAANAQIGIARAAMYPTLSLTGSLGFESTELAKLIEAPARFWSLGFGLALPLFDGGRNAARVDAAGARQREAVAAYQQAVSSAFKEVADALAGLRAARESEPDVRARGDSAARALELAKARFDAGYSGSLERLEAERTAAGAALEVVRNRERQLAATVDLMKALGGGWTGLPR